MGLISITVHALTKQEWLLLVPRFKPRGVGWEAQMLPLNWIMFWLSRGLNLWPLDIKERRCGKRGGIGRETWQPLTSRVWRGRNFVNSSQLQADEKRVRPPGLSSNCFTSSPYATRTSFLMTDLYGFIGSSRHPVFPVRVDQHPQDEQHEDAQR